MKKPLSKSQKMRRVTFHADYAVSQNCKNLKESYGEVCVKCGKCGRKFDMYGVLINPPK